jgi:hypothetical protein
MQSIWRCLVHAISERGVAFAYCCLTHGDALTEVTEGSGAQRSLARIGDESEPGVEAR